MPYHNQKITKRVIKTSPLPPHLLIKPYLQNVPPYTPVFFFNFKFQIVPFWFYILCVSTCEMVNIEWMRSLLITDMNRFLGYKNQTFKSWNTFSKNEQFDSTLTLSFSTSLAYPLNDVMISRIHKAF